MNDQIPGWFPAQEFYRLFPVLPEPRMITSTIKLRAEAIRNAAYENYMEERG